MDAISGSQSPGNGPGSSEVLGIGDKADPSASGSGTPVEEGLASGVAVHGGLEACPSGLRVPDVQADPLGQLREVLVEALASQCYTGWIATGLGRGCGDTERISILICEEQDFILDCLQYWDEWPTRRQSSYQIGRGGCGPHWILMQSGYHPIQSRRVTSYTIQ